MSWQAFIEDIESLVSEAGAKEVPQDVPQDPNIASTISRMSTDADHQAKRAKQLGTPSALKMATQSHSRVAQAAKVQGWDSLGGEHAQTVNNLHKAAEKATPDRANTKKTAKIKFGPQSPVTPDAEAVSKALQKKHGIAKGVANVPVDSGGSSSTPAR